MSIIPFSRLVLAQQVNKNTTIQEILAIEPTFKDILDLAAYPTPRYNRWVSYEALKRRARHLVGWYATHPTLQTTEHYEAMIWAIDLLLPSPEEDVLDTSIYEQEWQSLIEQWRNEAGKRHGEWYLLTEKQEGA